MHKAKLLLLAVFSLTMLLPLGNGMNKSSNAMALTEDLYPDMTKVGIDYSQYDRFYKDDNFRENYYNYHKQQHQHQPQQSGYDNNDYNIYETDKTTKYVNDMADYVEEKYQPYAKDNNYVKAQYSDFIKKIKCNNINSNLNGLNVNTLPGSTTAEDIGAQTLKNDDVSANSFGNSYERNNGKFAFDCINNNNNIVVEEVEEIEPISKICEECFAANFTLQTAISDAIANVDDGDDESFRISTVDAKGDIIADTFVFNSETDTIEKICNQIENAVENSGVPMSDTLVRTFFSLLLDRNGEGAQYQAALDDLIECLLEKGIIVHRDFATPPPSEICDNRIDDDGDGFVDGADSDCAP
ncbi:MAG TPA: hypothetical protein VFK40_00755 [Nitrososphaeraceae archaeon]|nr:hypothetical protein [Nitrososphaeraceae archaeon]